MELKSDYYNKLTEVDISLYVEMLDFFREYALHCNIKQPMNPYELDLKNNGSVDQTGERALEICKRAMSPDNNKILEMHGSMHASSNQIIRMTKPACDCPSKREQIACGHKCGRGQSNE